MNPEQALGFLISFANGCASTAHVWGQIDEARKALSPLVYPERFADQSAPHAPGCRCRACWGFADPPAMTETAPEVADDPYDGCLVAGCIYTRGHKGKCFQPGDVVPATTAPQGAPRLCPASTGLAVRPVLLCSLPYAHDGECEFRRARGGLK